VVEQIQTRQEMRGTVAGPSAGVLQPSGSLGQVSSVHGTSHADRPLKGGAVLGAAGIAGMVHMRPARPECGDGSRAGQDLHSASSVRRLSHARAKFTVSKQ